MKSIILTIRLKYFYLTYKGIKTIEVRKTKPKDFVGDVYEYVSKTNWEKDLLEIPENERDFFKKFVGKIGLKFTLNKVEEIRFDNKEVQRKACLTEDELFDYLFVNEPYHEDMKKGYAWHISNIVIFDKPKELSEFKHWVFYKKCERCPYGKSDYDYSLCSQCCEIKPLTKAPMSWCYIESEE